MKYLQYAVFAMAVMASCSKQAEFAKQPLQLQRDPLQIDIPAFFSDEAYFHHDKEPRISVDEGHTVDFDHNNPQKFVLYGVDVSSNTKKIPLAKYGDLNFPGFQLYADSRDEKVFAVVAETDSLTGEELVQLVQTLDTDFGKQTSNESTSSEQQKIWRKNGKVVVFTA